MKTSATTPPTNRPVATTAPTISCCGRFDAAGADFSCVVGWWMIGRTWEVCPTWEWGQSTVMDCWMRVQTGKDWQTRERGQGHCQSPHRVTESVSPSLTILGPASDAMLQSQSAAAASEKKWTDPMKTTKCASMPLPHGQIRKKCLTTWHYDQEGMECSTHLIRTYPGLCSRKAKSVCYCNVSAILAQQHERSGWWLRQFLSWFDHSSRSRVWSHQIIVSVMIWSQLTLSCLKPLYHSFCHDLMTVHTLMSEATWPQTSAEQDTQQGPQIQPSVHGCWEVSVARCQYPVLVGKERKLMYVLGVLWNLTLSGCPAVRKTRRLPFLDTFEKSSTRAADEYSLFSRLQSLVMELNSCTSVRKGLGAGKGACGRRKKERKKMRTLIYCMRKGRRVGRPAVKCKALIPEMAVSPLDPNVWDFGSKVAEYWVWL